MNYVLLHGSFHAAWNWHRVSPLLQAKGHHALALDLPGHGQDRTPARKVSLQACVDKVVACLRELPAPAVLVAHSRNGIVISQVAEQCPECVAGLVYLAAYLVPDGKTMMDYAAQDTASLVVQNVVPRLGAAGAARLGRWLRRPWGRVLLPRCLPAARQTHRLRPEAYHQALYHDCPPEITALAHALLEPEPNWSGFTPLRLSHERYGRVPRVYVQCLQDRAVTLPLQQRMVAESACAHVYALDSGHSPFFSQPQQLVDVLVDAQRFFVPAAGQSPDRA